MYVTSKHKLPLLAALFFGVSAQAFAANGVSADCASHATAQAQKLCHDQAIMRDYALGLTSETLVDTPPVSLGVTPPRESRDAAAARDKSRRPLSLLSGGLLDGGTASQAPEVAQKLPPKAEARPANTAKSQAKASKSQALSTLIERRPASGLAGQDGTINKWSTLPGDGTLRRYVALGDFSVPDDATEVAQAFDLWNPRIQHVYIRGRHYRRVLVGPFSDREIKSVKLHLDQHGFSTAWPLRTTADATPETLIARYPGDG